MVEGIAVFLLCMLVPWAGWFAWGYVLGPVRLRRSFRVSADPRYESVALGAFPPAVAKACLAADRALEAEGFKQAGCVRAERNCPPGVDVCETIWANDATRELALFVGVLLPRMPGPVPDRPGPAPSSLSTSFTLLTEYPEHRSLHTSNAAWPGAFETEPMEGTADVLTCPDVADVRRLVAVHRAHTARANFGEPVLPVPRDPVEYLRQRDHSAAEQRVAAGYWWRDEAKGVYRLTWKGARVTAWKLLWPWDRRLRRELAGRASAELRSLGFDERGRPLAPQPADPGTDPSTSRA